ncbi:MAG: hypothetical protein Q8O03_02620 [Nanoarchaeota archaeon]|nr:hypothetical protein [Nanoarchaeota archaeon]
MKKAQISLEILFVIGFVIFVFIILLAFTMERRHEIGELEEAFKEKAECYKLSNLISGVYSSNSGTGLIETLKYEAEIDADEGSIFIGEGRYFCTFPISSVRHTDSGEKIFSLNKGSITLNNTDGVVKIKNA